MRILPPAFYQRPTLTVARDLLGKIFIRRLDDTLLSGRIVEVEAYHQQGDEAAHTFRGRTARNRVMFRAGGVLYVYFTYGMHHCMNVVTEQDGVGAAVLIRALEPREGIESMRALRGGNRRDRDLLAGPARLCQALALTREHNGLPLDGVAVGIADAPAVPDDDILTTTRVGISRGRDLPWRFCLAGSPWCSPGRPSLPNP
ncbi:MAG: DNA-3-methyladenine glycosylase [Bacteroidota bacterium]|jgi:DNA-3-methyladenine glycosylase|nr:DNA-3-methyladenine glycosylase [Bacteroidota bacterium]